MKRLANKKEGKERKNEGEKKEERQLTDIQRGKQPDSEPKPEPKTAAELEGKKRKLHRYVRKYGDYMISLPYQKCHHQ